MKRFLLFCSGANTEVLKSCPTDESKYVGIGATILLTAILASLSGGYALFTVFGSTLAAVPFGAFWGVVIFNLDRVIVSGMRKQKAVWIDFLYALPRLGLSVLLAVVISRPLELRLFEAEIIEQWERTQLQKRNADRDTIVAGDAARIATLNAEKDTLQGEIDARSREFQAAEQAWMKEKEGSAGTGIPGEGPVFAEKERIMNNADLRLKETEGRNRPLIDKRQREIDSIKAAQDSRFAQTSKVSDQASGFLARIEALGVLKEKSRTIHWASIFITLLFIALEIAPVMVKLLSTFNPYRPYDELLEQREFEVVELARQQVKVRRHALKARAERKIAGYDDEKQAEMELSTQRSQLRLNAELQANEELMQRIADAQVDLAGVLVDEWKANEMDKIVNGRGNYAPGVP
ncbi:MAG TPA: DUF4407 domain-containing protein [Longimicrobium sp.]|nr:DUF4407 domain-containing protein [Longimicrobium sp.]